MKSCCSQQSLSLPEQVRWQAGQVVGVHAAACGMGGSLLDSGVPVADASARSSRLALQYATFDGSAQQLHACDACLWLSPPHCMQVKLMSDTSVLVTPGGGLAAMLNFLRPSATAIPLMYWNTITNTSSSLDLKYYP